MHNNSSILHHYSTRWSPSSPDQPAIISNSVSVSGSNSRCLPSGLTKKLTTSTEISLPETPTCCYSTSCSKKVDYNLDLTSLSTSSKSYQYETSLEELKDTATSPLSPWKKQEIHILNDIIVFYEKYGTYPFDDTKNMGKLYDEWTRRRGFCKNEDVLSNKVVDLHERFLMNITNASFRDDIESWMDPIEVKIFRLSYRIWGK
ncbi:probable transcription factor [Tanacetum coccineum]|uniref:Probable transcription factor n=1 Tax=Tanacetum coccineum TaxID=301880 RepID=A0ABQ5DFC8_9ASTR